MSASDWWPTLTVSVPFGIVSWLSELTSPGPLLVVRFGRYFGVRSLLEPRATVASEEGGWPQSELAARVSGGFVLWVGLFPGSLTLAAL